jgi:hypothetical protein
VWVQTDPFIYDETPRPTLTVGQTYDYRVNLVTLAETATSVSTTGTLKMKGA